MPDIFHSIANRAAALFMKLLFGYSSRVYVIGRENAERGDGFLLASNHISHFDPLIISSVLRRKIDWMAMAEFFPMPIVGLFLRAVDAFPAERGRADRKTIRTASEKLKSGHAVGIFPEGGIRDGANSLLEGATVRTGASALAHMAGMPIVPCVIVGSDRLYAKRSWLPMRRTPVWIGFGKPISNYRELEKAAARERIEAELTAAFQKIYTELREKFQLVSDDLPHSPRERMRSRVGALRRPDAAARRPYLHRARAGLVDFGMCAAMNLLQSRHRLNGTSLDEMKRYVVECEKLNAHEYYAAPHAADLARAIREENPTTVMWRSPVETKFERNNIARVDFF